MADLDRKTYLELLLNGATQFINETGIDRLRKAFAGGDEDVEELLHAYVTGILARADRLADVIKVAGRDDPDPRVWRDAVNWSEVLFRVAYLMVMEDLKEQASRMCQEGETILTAPPAE